MHCLWICTNAYVYVYIMHFVYIWIAMLKILLRLWVSIGTKFSSYQSIYNECTEVQNPRRGYSWPLITIMRMRTFHRKMADRTYGFQRTSAGSPQRSGFRENPTNFLTSIARWVHDSIFKTNRRSRGEMWLNRQTDTDRTTTVTLLRMRTEG